MQRRHLLSLAALPLIADAAPAAVRTRVDTPLGPFVIAVDPAVAPVTVANYLAYVDQHLLDQAWVYRLVTTANQTPDTTHKIEVVQWGLNLPDDATPRLPAIAHETTKATGLRHRDGTVSMARGAPGTATAEFFICIGDQPALDFGGLRNPDGQGFAAFGQVVQGMAVVRALHAKAGAEQWLKAPLAIGPVQRV
ncbi:peptidylprolyl isomerase [Roseateles sp.]|uniref:peptidylprolyl isomerase n=1 Tax=Roseateles sp. TaxID=1971397 RepID=UPI003BA860AC